MQSETFVELRIKTQDDGTVMVEQPNGFDEPSRIYLHGLHVRRMAEKMGMLTTTDPDAQRLIRTLTRRMVVLHGRIKCLADLLASHSGAQVDLNFESCYAAATADIAEEFCAELSDPLDPPQPMPACQPSETPLI